MALNTLKVGDLRRLLSGLPDDQEVLLIDDSGVAVEIDVDPLTVVDVATGKQVLTLEFICDPSASDDGDRFFGFDYSDKNHPTINSGDA